MILLGLLFASALAAADPTPGSQDAPDEILVVDEADLERMWRAVKTPGPRYDQWMLRGIDRACVSVGYVIEADGRTSTARVLRSVPTGKLDAVALAAIARWRFKPGADNPERTPVYSTGTFTVTGHVGGPSGSRKAARTLALCDVDLVPGAASQAPPPG